MRIADYIYERNLLDCDATVRKRHIYAKMSLKLCSGDLMKEEEVLYWLFHHVDHEEIADVTDEMLGKLIANEPFLAVLFCECRRQQERFLL